MTTSPSLYHGYRYPGEIISHAVWMYLRFNLSFRNVEEILVSRSVDATYESIRQWCLRIGHPARPKNVSTRIQQVKMTLPLAVPVWLVTLVVGGTAVLAADFGASAWVFLLLFAWLLTIGLPTTLGVAAVASVWSGGGLGAFLAVAAGVSLLFQVAGMHEFRRLWRYWRGTRNSETTG